MRILFTNHHLAELGGTEVFIREITTEWLRRGHQVAVLTLRIGPFAESLRQTGVEIVTHPRDLTFTPELIHGQHHLPTMLALQAFPHCPALYHCHGYAPWQEQPPSHPRIVHYLGIAEQMRSWLKNILSIGDEKVTIFPVAVDTEKFAKVRQPPTSLRNALLFGNNLQTNDPAVVAAKEACQKIGINLSSAGHGLGIARPSPETWLTEYDLVFAIGRSALEALASGCAVIPLDAQRVYQILTPDNFAASQHLNFTVANNEPLATADIISERLATFDATKIQAVTQHARHHCSLKNSFDQLEQLHQQLLLADSSNAVADQSSAMSNYLLSIATLLERMETENAAFRQKLDQQRQKRAELTAKLERERQRFSVVENILSASYFSRRWLRKIHRALKALPKSDSRACSDTPSPL